MDKLPFYPPNYLEAVYLVKVKSKEEEAKRLIKKYAVGDKVAVALSGKDSIVVAHLSSVVRQIDIVVSAYVANRRLPQAVIDELITIAKSLGARVIVHDQPWDVHASLFQLISRE